MLAKLSRSLVLVLALAGGIQAFHDCNHEVWLEPGYSQSVTSPGYDQGFNYTAGSSCRWMAKSSVDLYLSCDTFHIPENRDCAMNAMVVTTQPMGVHFFCGKPPINLQSSGAGMEIRLISLVEGGGRFSCNIMALNEPDDMEIVLLRN